MFLPGPLLGSVIIDEFFPATVQKENPVAPVEHTFPVGHMPNVAILQIFTAPLTQTSADKIKSFVFFSFSLHEHVFFPAVGCERF